MSTLEHQKSHYSPPPAPPDEVDVKNLVSQFSRSTIHDTEIKLPPEKRKIAKYLTDTKKNNNNKHKQAHKTEDGGFEPYKVEIDPEGSLKDRNNNPKDRNKPKNTDNPSRAKNKQDDKNSISQHETITETTGGESSSSASEENTEENHQKPSHRRKRQGSDDGYNSTTSSGTSSPRRNS